MKQHEYKWVIPGLLFQIIGVVMALIRYHPTEAFFGRLLAMIGTYLLIKGLGIYAREKGYHGIWGWLAFLSIAGVVVVALLKRHPDAPYEKILELDDPKKEKNRRKGLRILRIMTPMSILSFITTSILVMDIIINKRWIVLLVLAGCLAAADFVLTVFFPKKRKKAMETLSYTDKLSNAKKHFFIIAVVGIVCWGSIFALAKTYAPWPKLVPDVRLEPSRPYLTEEDVTSENAFYYVRQLGDYYEEDALLFKDVQDTYHRFEALGYTDEQCGDLETWVEDNSEILAIAEKAVEIEYCQVTTCDSYTQLLPELGVARDVIRLLKYRAERNADNGEWDLMLKNYRTIFTLSGHLARGGALIHGLVQIAGYTIGCDSIRRVALTYDVPKDISRLFDELLLITDRNTEPIDEALRYERLMAIKIMQSNVIGLLPFRFTFLMGSLGQAMQSIDIVFSNVINIVSTPYAPDRFEKEIVHYLEYPRSKKTFIILSADPITRIMLGMLVEGLEKAQIQWLKNSANLRATRVVLAIRQYQQERGSIPATLDELVPGYIDAIPADPFAPGKLLKYKTSDDSWTVYSLGRNQVDDGGIDGCKKNHHDCKNGLDYCLSADEFERKKEKYLEKQQRKNRIN